MPSCTTRLPQVEAEHHALLTAFAAAGLANEQTLQLFMPLSRYKRLLGAAQLNASETLARRVGVGPPSACLVLQPFVLPTSSILRRFNPRLVCGRGDVAADEELCISYLDVEQSVSDRRHLLLQSTGSSICERCVRESAQRL